MPGPNMADHLPLTLRLYRSVLRRASPVAGRIVARRLKRGKEDPARVTERRGVASRARPPGHLVWVHGASVGEILAVAALVERLIALGFHVLLTSGTRTSAEVAAKRFPPEVIHQFVPYDLPSYIARFLDHWRPSMALFVESDLWPNLILANAERRIPMILLNGRISERSFRRWRRMPSTIAALLGRFDLCLAQSPTDGERLSELGAPRVLTTGNLKLDVPAPPADAAAVERLTALVKGRPVIAAASTHAGEESLIIDTHIRLRAEAPGLLTIIVPRHPRRGEEVAHIAASRGLKFALRSRNQPPASFVEVYIADTVGELGLFYRVAPIVFMGGSLVEHGGQNPIEAIRLGAAVAHGPHVWNFAELYQTLDEGGGTVAVADGAALLGQMRRWLTDPRARQRSSEAGLRMVEASGGALDRTLAVLEPYLLQLRIEGDAAYA